MSGFGSRPTAAPVPIDANRRALAEALLGLPARVGQAFTGMANAGLQANEAFLQGRGQDGEDLYARPLLPGADTGGRLGALASFLNSNMALGGPAGSLGAGISTEGRGATAANVAARTANALPMDEASRMARAAEQGFTVDAYHGTAPAPVWQSVDELKSQLNNYNGFNSFRDGSYFATNPNYAGGFANAQAAERAFGNGANVMPVKLRTSNPYDARGDSEFWQKLRANPEKVSRPIKEAGHDSILMRETDRPDVAGDVYYIFDPNNIRSRFAAFDPARRNEADLLASYGPNPLAGALLGYQPQE